MMRGTLALAASIVAAASFGCNKLECGLGTIEKDDQCIAATDPGTSCAPGTTYSSATGRCENDLFSSGGGLCGDNTTQVVNDAGVRVCQGTGGGSGDCNTPLPCPAATGNTVSLCGRIFDLEDSKPLDDGDATNGEAWKTVEIKVLNPFEFIGNPNAEPLDKMTHKPDSCGRFAMPNVPRPGAGAVAVLVDDAADAGRDDRALTGIAALVEVGTILPTMRAWTLRRTTDQAWSSSANLPSGTTFSAMGVYVPIFLAPGPASAPFPQAPTPGVKVALLDPSGTRLVSPDKDFYFGDTQPGMRRTVDTRDSTGANGTGLYIMQPGLGTFSGVGAAPAGTCWEKSQAAAPVGGVFVQERTADAQSCP